MLHQHPDGSRHQASRRGVSAMNPASRRDFLKASGGLVVSFAAGQWTVRAQGPLAGSPALSQLDTWLAIASDGSVTAYSGKEELGQGISTAQTQLVAEELCLPFNRVKLIYCDTAITPDQ